ncbi:MULTISPECIES: hypothetical protein [unclassified Burkholderia]|uniref:hypothetical protein n=1 Tax=unclassified Burkholderia TaxID=2613784 RepID=UPI001420D109|nr:MULTISPECIES: hypothetical protein [unclassified Burkholderia]NIE83227.1 hypothetical protein [Burkholderia sp. Tr-860]NIF62760.1 hypothetical protein [Burkholderia sp. Cy-647]NIF95558.1 hypothetical protein [Burkholderia sp. Ax-1720]
MYVQQFLFVSHSYFTNRDDVLGGYLPPAADPRAYAAPAPAPAPRRHQAVSEPVQDSRQADRQDGTAADAPRRN